MAISSLRIGIIADTHEAADPLALIELLQRAGCAVNVHLGDVGGSPLVTNLVRHFKRTDSWYEEMVPAERRRYRDAVAAGAKGARAYIRAMLGDDPDAQERRERETIASYREIVGAMRGLPGLHVVLGNIDAYWINHEPVRALFDRGVPLHLEPTRLLAGGIELAIWPSTRTDEGSRARIAAATRRLARELRGGEPLPVLAHEQPFRGPTAGVYRRRVLAAGYRPATIPHYAPGPNRECLLGLARALWPRRIGLASGHVHDPAEVLAAGAPYLRSREGDGLELRLRGVGRGIGDGGGSKVEANRRATMRLFPVGVDEVGILTVGDGGLAFEVIRSGRPLGRGDL